MNIKWIVNELHACGHVRGEVVAREINANIPNMIVDIKPNIVMSDFCRANMMIFQRAHRPDYLEKMFMAKERRIKTVYEIDDDLFSIPAEFTKAHKFFSNPDTQTIINAFITTADAIICSTDELAVGFSVRAPKTPIYIIDNFIDTDKWKDAYIKRVNREPKDKVIIGWLASGSHIIDVPIIKPVFESILDQYPNVYIHFIGSIEAKDIGLEKYSDRMIFEQWTPVGTLAYAMADFDISICPLADIHFNRCKSNLKYLQASALGIPSVCSKLPCYERVIKDNEDGFICTDTVSWLACMQELIENEDLRISIGEKAREKIEEKHDMRTNYLQWVNAFERIMKG